MTKEIAEKNKQVEQTKANAPGNAETKKNTASGKSKHENPQLDGTENFKRLLTVTGNKNPVINKNQRKWEHPEDFNTVEGLKRVLKTSQEFLEFQENQLAKVLDEIVSYIDKQKMQGKGRNLEYPDPENLYTWRGVFLERLEESLARRDVEARAVEKARAELKEFKAKQTAKQTTDRRNVKPKVQGIVQNKSSRYLYPGDEEWNVPIKADGMDVEIRKIKGVKVPYIASHEYYGHMSLENYVEDIVRPHKKQLAKSIREKEARIRAMQSGKIPMTPEYQELLEGKQSKFVGNQ